MIQRLADHVDGLHHIALPLVVPPPDGSGRPAGRARRVQDPADPTTAETAFAVADEWQGRGPGTALVHALMQRRPAAVRRLHAAIDACKPPHACYPPGTETELADLRPKRCPPETTRSRKYSVGRLLFQVMGVSASALTRRSASDNHTGCPLGSGSGARSCTTRTTTAGSPTRPGGSPLPRSKQEEQSDREQWPWLPATIAEQCGLEEWYVCVEARELAVLCDGRRAPRGTASRNLYYPCCFRDRSEIRPRTASSGAVSATRPGAGGNRDRARRPSPDS